MTSLTVQPRYSWDDEVDKGAVTISGKISREHPSYLPASGWWPGNSAALARGGCAAVRSFPATLRHRRVPATALPPCRDPTSPTCGGGTAAAPLLVRCRRPADACSTRPCCSASQWFIWSDTRGAETSRDDVSLACPGCSSCSIVSCKVIEHSRSGRDLCGAVSTSITAFCRWMQLGLGPPRSPFERIDDASAARSGTSTKQSSTRSAACMCLMHIVSPCSSSARRLSARLGGRERYG